MGYTSQSRVHAQALVTLTRLCIAPVPTWLDIARLCGVGDAPTPLELEPLDEQHVRVRIALPANEAADVAARLRGLGIDGRALEVTSEPPLARSLVRAARLRDARARRLTSQGFTRPGAVASGAGRYSLTPEALALELGRLAAGARVLDACCGSGGNSIGFARAGSPVQAIELDAERLAEARVNARLYGVGGQIRFSEGDALELLREHEAELLFVDPPWGEHYDKRSSSRASFPLLDALLALDLRRFRELWLKLPSSFEVASIPGARPTAWFGSAPGDWRRIKFLLLRVPTSALGGGPG